MSEQIYEYSKAIKTARDYVCSGCYGELVLKGVERACDLFLVACPNCGNDRGFVTRHYAEQKRAESAAEAREARRNLEDAIPALKQPKRSAAEIMRDLGF